MSMQPDELRANRVRDVETALIGRLNSERVTAVIARLIAANEHIGAAYVGAGLAAKLETSEGRLHLVSDFGVGERVLATAALNLGIISVHSALDLCAAAVLIASDAAIPALDEKEYGMRQLIEREKERPLWECFSFWLRMTNDFYEELTTWRNPQAHRVVLKGYSANEPTNRISGVSVQVYGAKGVLGTASEATARFADRGEERFLGLCYALQQLPSLTLS